LAGAEPLTHSWLEVLRPDVQLGAIRHALFDFDGTLSLVRQGWEGIMAPLMLEMICAGAAPLAAIQREVEEYIDRSTGILTIEQMAWLAEAVRRHGLAPRVGAAREYKRLYTERLLVPVRRRLQRLAAGELSSDDLMVPGARCFVERLHLEGVTLYLVSGTDHEQVCNEATALGLAPYFGGRIYGALDTAAHTKERIITRILSDNGLQGPELLVVGDGRVEMQQARAQGAVALGVASAEVSRSGWEARKRERLIQAGADLLVPDLGHGRELAELLLGRRTDP